MRAFILAGGFATRLWPLTEKRAKPLLPLRGKPILTHLVEKIPADLPVTVSTNAAFEDAFEEWRRDLGRSETEIVVEGTKHDDENSAPSERRQSGSPGGTSTKTYSSSRATITWDSPWSNSSHRTMKEQLCSRHTI